MTQQMQFGGAWTEQKLDALSKYLRAYTRIFKKNPRAQYFSTTYVDAFAGTGVLPIPELGSLIEHLPETLDEYRKGSAKRALEVDPAFDRYIFIEKDTKKCEELRTLASHFANRRIEIINEDANHALLEWCTSLNTKTERAVVFLDPFGASVEWRAISALGRTRAVDLWILFPFSAINRMLIRDRKPPAVWAARLTKIFGTADWEQEFYSQTVHPNILDPTQKIEKIYKTANPVRISEFFVKRLKQAFTAVGEPLALYNSNAALLFLLYFAAANDKSATTGMKIANDIIGS